MQRPLASGGVGFATWATTTSGWKPDSDTLGHRFESFKIVIKLLVYLPFYQYSCCTLKQVPIVSRDFHCTGYRNAYSSQSS